MTPVTRSSLAMLLLLSTQVVSDDTLKLEVCYNYGCKEKASILLAEKDFDLLRSMFHGLDSAEKEKASIRQAIAQIEKIVGRNLPTVNDVGGNYQKGMVEIGQMDCIDESTNTTSYLTFLQQQGLLRWHEVEERAFRAPYLFDQHWAAQIRERNSGDRFVVDSWFDDNGKPPLIQPLDDWKRKH